MPDLSFLKLYFDIPIAVTIVALLAMAIQILHTKFPQKHTSLKGNLLLVFILLSAVEAATIFVFGFNGEQKSAMFYITAILLFVLYITFALSLIVRVSGEFSYINRTKKAFTLVASSLYLSVAIFPLIFELLGIVSYTNSLLVISILIEFTLIIGYFIYRKRLEYVGKSIRFVLIITLLFNAMTILIMYFGFFDISLIALETDNNINTKLLFQLVKFILMIIFAGAIGWSFLKRIYFKEGMRRASWINIIFLIVINLLLIIFSVLVVYFTKNVEDGLYELIDLKTDLIADTVDKHDIEALEGTPEDEYKPAYRDLQNFLEEYIDSGPELTYLYIYGMGDTGTIINYVEVKSGLSISTDEPFSPGDVYPDPSESMLRVFNEKRDYFEGPVKDDWGVWYSEMDSLVLENGKVFLVGGDMDAAYWVGQIFVERADVVSMFLLVLLLILVAYDIGLSVAWILESLELSQKKFKNIYDHSSDAIVLVESGKIADANPMASKLFGYSLTQLKGLSFLELSTDKQKSGESSQDLFDVYINDIQKNNGIQFEWEFKTKKGTMMGSVSFNEFLLQGKQYYIMLIRDISSQKKLDNERLKHISELERINKIMIGRELKMIELKNKIKDMELQKQ